MRSRQVSKQKRLSKQGPVQAQSQKAPGGAQRCRVLASRICLQHPPQRGLASWSACSEGYSSRNSGAVDRKTGGESRSGPEWPSLLPLWAKATDEERSSLAPPFCPGRLRTRSIANSKIHTTNSEPTNGISKSRLPLSSIAVSSRWAVKDQYTSQVADAIANIAASCGRRTDVTVIRGSVASSSFLLCFS